MSKVKSQKSKVDETELLQQQLQQVKNQLARALADYDNLRKRSEEEKTLVVRFATEGFILKLLPVVDILNKTLKEANEAGQKSPWLEGMRIADLELRKILKDEGLEEISVSGKFDPNLHEAIEIEDGPEGTILDVFQMGYKLNGKLIRPARVSVGRG